MKKALKILRNIIIILFVLILLLMVGLMLRHRMACKKDLEMLKNDGLCNLVTAGDYKMNVNTFGSSDAKHTVIAMPGSGHSTFPVHMKAFSEHLGDDVRLVSVSRPGYDLSTETKSDITTEFIVESTRTALKNAGIEGPYILMPHSLSGIYGTYWESVYPDEVEGVLFLDSVNEASDIKVSPDEMSVSLMDRIYNKIGAMRIFYKESDYRDFMLPDEYQKDAYALTAYNSLSPQITEECGKNLNDNCSRAWASIETNDIPKTYISTYYETIEDVKDEQKFMYGEVKEDQAVETFERETAEENEDYRKKRSEYLKKLGNCNEVNIAGSHFIYAQKPDEVAEQLDKLIERIK